MKLDLKKIHDFYQSDLGRYAMPHIRLLLKNAIPKHVNKMIYVCSAGIFPVEDVLDGVERVVMQSTTPIPDFNDNTRKGRFVIIGAKQWPYRAEDVDHIILIHDIEFMSNPEAYLQEAWRVLKGEGQLTIIFPNRAGRWVRKDNNPFGKGYPYTPQKMEKILNKAHFTIDDMNGALYFPPYRPKTKLASILFQMMEQAGQYCFLTPGVIALTASKHIHAPTKGLKVMDIATQKAKQALFPNPAMTPKNHKEKTA